MSEFVRTAWLSASYVELAFYFASAVILYVCVSESFGTLEGQEKTADYTFSSSSSSRIDLLSIPSPNTPEPSGLESQIGL